jgi:hypothetical protein
MIILTQLKWAEIVPRVYDGQPTSVRYIRERHKEVLGFVVRSGRADPKKIHGYTHLDLLACAFYDDGKVEAIFLDFYSDAAETLFRLRFL